MIRSFLIRCSGANPDILKKCPIHESMIKAGIGGIILGTSALAFLSGGYGLYMVFKAPWVACGFGLLWALIIFNIDRYVIMTMKSGAFWTRFQSCLPRLLLGMVIGLVISEPLKLELFRSEIEEELDSGLREKTAQVAADFDRQVTLLKNSRKASDLERQRGREAADRSFMEGRASLDAEIARLEQEKADRDAVKQSRYELYLGECAGRAGTGIRGEGPECRRTRKAYEDAAKEYDQTIALNDIKITNLKAQVADLDNRRLEEISKVESEWRDGQKRLDENEKAIRQKRQVSLDQLERIFSDGFLARFIALRDLVKRHHELWAMDLMVSLLFILIEVAPVMAKMMQPEGPYDYVLKREDEEVQLDQEAASKVNRSFILGKEFFEHLWSKRLLDTQYAGIRSMFDRVRVFADDNIQQKTWFDGILSGLFARMNRVKDEKLMKNEQRSMDAMINAHYESEALSYGKFHDMLNQHPSEANQSVLH